MTRRSAQSEWEFDLAQAPSHLIRRCQQYFGDLYANEAGARELTPSSSSPLLAALEHNEGVSQTALVEITGIDRSTLAEMVRRMLDKGLLSRERTEEDQRANAVAITPSGRKALRSARTASSGRNGTAGVVARIRPREIREAAGADRGGGRSLCRQRRAPTAPQGPPQARLTVSIRREYRGWRRPRLGRTACGAGAAGAAGALARLLEVERRERGLPGRFQTPAPAKMRSHRMRVLHLPGGLLGGNEKICTVELHGGSLADHGFQSLKITRARPGSRAAAGWPRHPA